jgi:hypothetical protein
MSYDRHPHPNKEMPPQCLVCDRLEKKRIKGRYWYRCLAGRFDIDGGPAYYAWRGITKPNKAVAKAQKDCHKFFYSYDVSETEVAHEVL